tara:strand:- start:78 stop:350 length:273 start_codon:yes stop_codon:yes gene_type:complete
MAKSKGQKTEKSTKETPTKTKESTNETPKIKESTDTRFVNIVRDAWRTRSVLKSPSLKECPNLDTLELKILVFSINIILRYHLTISEKEE